MRNFKSISVADPLFSENYEYVLQGSLYAVRHSYNYTRKPVSHMAQLQLYKEACELYGTAISVCLSQTIRSTFKFVKFFKEACMPYGTPISVCLLQTIRSMFKFFTYQGSLYAVQNTY